MKTKINANILRRNAPIPISETAVGDKPNVSMNGTCHPPRKSTVITALAAIMFAYSARKNSAHFIELYSVWYPPTSSGSASGRSKGWRFVSAKEDVIKRIKPSGAHRIFQPCSTCAFTIKRTRKHNNREQTKTKRKFIA
jgi:hypothetical protein